MSDQPAGEPKLAYLLNTYPLTSTTFIRREIEALERRGVGVTRFALRQWDGELVDPLDQAEVARTQYILTDNAFGLLSGFLTDLFANPGGLFRAIGPWWSLLRKARGGVVRHTAYFLEAIRFRRLAAAQGIDHVHVHFLTNSTAVAMLARLMGGPSYSITVHGPDELTDAPLLDFPAKIANASFIAAITHYCKSQLIRFSAIEQADKIEIVHCALDLGDFPDAGPPPDNEEIICVGRLCPQKGQVQIPRVVARLRDDFPNLKISLVGDGESRADIEREIVAHGVGDQVEILGWRANDEVRRRIAASRALLLPSFAEGLPVVIMEALALKRPVISTYIAGIPELLDDGCGWIIPAGDGEALERAIRSVLSTNPDDLARKGEEGRRRIEARHDVDIEAGKLWAHIRERFDNDDLTA
ncbi:MAG: glycosyltransferase family 4 protein [Pseudomonadota bacterium]